MSSCSEQLVTLVLYNTVFWRKKVLIASSLSEFLKIRCFLRCVFWFWWRNIAELLTPKEYAYKGIVVPEGWMSCMSNHDYFTRACLVVLWYSP